MRVCRSCGAEVLFFRSAAKGRWMILDATPNQERGTIALLGGDDVSQAAVVLTGEALDDARRRGSELFLDHHATCPQADAWRRAR